MPCTISEADARAYERERNKRLTGRALDDKALATAVACAACKELVKLHGPMDDAPEFVQKWWREHKRQDAERERSERAEARRKSLAARARAKLSKEELEALRG